MYCINCGVRLADSEKKCPLCGTTVYHPEIQRKEGRPLYPINRTPKVQTNPKVINGFFLIMLLIPMLVCFLADLKRDGNLDWFGHAAGGLIVAYVAIALPMWFRRPNPVIFVPCNFATVLAYLFYINWAINGNWFLSFAFPVVGCLGLIVSAVVTLLYYVRKGALYILGGGFIALGGFMLLVEFMLDITFNIPFIAWSVYPLIVFALLGGGLIYLAINSSARETMERKLFF